jgi:hypothetical protein
MNAIGPVLFACFSLPASPAVPPLPAEAHDAPVAIHLVTGAEDLEAAREKTLAELALDPRPWLGPADIAAYDSSARLLYLREGVRPPALKPSLRGTPFVLTAKGERIFLGAFWSLVSSFLPADGAPVINMPAFEAAPDTIALDIVRIEKDGEVPAERKDPREDPRLLAAFREAGRLREGLEVRLERVEVAPRGKGATVRYTYTLKSRDADPLLVLDPDRMGSPLFHHFTNGVGLTRRGTELHIIRPDLTGFTKGPPAGKEVDPSWLSVLPPGGSMTRTVELPAYPQIPRRRFEASFAFHGPLLRSPPPAGLTGGRLWLGSVESRMAVEVR